MGQVSSTDCERMRGYVSASLDRELSEVEDAIVDAHLAWCMDCRAYAADAASTARVLRETPLEELNFPIVLPGRRIAVARRLQVAAVAAAIAVAVGVGASLGHSPGQAGSSSASTAGAASRWSTEAELKMLHRASLRGRSTGRAHLAL